MIRKNLNEFNWLEFEILQDFPQIRHLISLKNSSLQQLEQEFSTPLITAKQVHGNYVEKISNVPGEPPTCDAMSTNQKGIGLTIKHADCQAAIIYDPIHHAAVCVHAGWRGSVHNIYREAIHHMQTHYNSQPENLMMCVGPSLGPENAEFINYQTELPEEFWEFQVKPLYFDFWAISEKQALDCGILPHHLEIAKMDTHSDEFHSYRKTKTEKRHYTAMCLI